MRRAVVGVIKKQDAICAGKVSLNLNRTLMRMLVLVGAMKTPSGVNVPAILRTLMKTHVNAGVMKSLSVHNAGKVSLNLNHTLIQKHACAIV